MKGVVPEGVFGSTIALCADNNDTLQTIQGDLNDSLLQALRTIAGEDTFSTLEVVSKAEPEPLPEAKPVQPYLLEISPTVAGFGKESYGAEPVAAPRESISVTEPQFPIGRRKINRDLETHLNKNLTLDSFMPGDSSRSAHMATLAVAEGSGQDSSPPCIYDGSSLGKTHLLNAIGNYALVKDPGLEVQYVAPEGFTNGFIDALQNPNQGQGQITESNRRY